MIGGEVVTCDSEGEDGVSGFVSGRLGLCEITSVGSGDVPSVGMVV